MTSIYTLLAAQCCAALLTWLNCRAIRVHGFRLDVRGWPFDVGTTAVTDGPMRYSFGTECVNVVLCATLLIVFVVCFEALVRQVRRAVRDRRALASRSVGSDGGDLGQRDHAKVQRANP